MNKGIWILFLFNSYLFAMDAQMIAERGEVKLMRIRSSSRNEDEELARIAVCLFFQNNECEVTRVIKDKLRDKIRSLRDSEDDDEKLDRMRRLTPPCHKKDPRGSKLRKQVHKDKELESMINSMVMDALKEYGEDKDRAIKYLEQRAARKECHKRWAIGVAIATLIIGTTTTLVVNFVD